MRAVVCQHAELAVQELPDPVPARGQVLLQVEACGICGSDLHARHHAEELAEAAAATGYDHVMRPDDAVVMGHEVCATVLDHGPRTPARVRPGTRVAVFPLLRAAGAVHTTGLSPLAPGGYAERMLAEQSMVLPVPNGLAADAAALTEPMAVALHAVRRGAVGRRQVAYVVGCGPIGLAVVAMLKATGVRTVVASDPSPGRRALAERMGADLVVDPATGSPFEPHAARHQTAAGLFELAVGSMERLRALPLVPWWQVMRAAEAAGATPSGPVVFECVGVPGILDHLVATAPLASRVVVVGVCMGQDAIRPAIAINKEIDLRFVLGYTPRELRDALHLLAQGEVDPTPLLSAEVGLDGVAAAFDALADPGALAKVVVRPGLEGTDLHPVATR